MSSASEILLITHYKEFSSLMFKMSEANKAIKYDSDIAIIAHYRVFSLLIHEITKINNKPEKIKLIMKCKKFILDIAYTIIMRFGLKEFVKRSKLYNFLKGRKII